ncbi:hypothetical protein [Robertmurraya andreesenii]|uniref:Uncharacterized protein n=1 Tax=Anoxybacillus andreesenii TaxID=1325932 RepID=A0ABT9V6Z1_9BACL|nr:hypothetical protein [Robertmurraya andreesenii]MDQ0156692.1 hypothetical protein [Robertmurraya andreesenii]
MDRKKLIELVDRLKKSGIKASITKPRSKTLIVLKQQAAPSN